MPYTDLFLYDIKCFDDEKHKKYTGIGNELIFSNLEMIIDMGADVWVRIPIVPIVNDTVSEMEKIKGFLDSVGGVKKVELLPYHGMGEHKYEALGKKSTSFTVPEKEKMELLRKIFN